VEFVVGLLSFLIVGAWAAVALQRGGRVREASLWTAIGLQAGVLASLWLDWGYSWVDETAMHMALESNVWVAVPHGLALLCLLGLMRWGRDFAPWASVLSALQGALFVPVLLQVERNTSMSFLALAPILAMFAAVLASFLFLPSACVVIPEPGSRWHRIAFGPRKGLIAAIEGLGDLGLDVRAPGSVFESGAAAGRMGRVGVEVSTVPALFPPAYGLRVRLVGPAQAPGALPDLPGFAQRERLRVVDGTVEYEGWTASGFSVEPARLQAFVRGLAEGA
jgi:hypothetical protein